ncbi:LysM peptidoglycan-binding domain-containing protein [Xanthomarina gelatinilytica]|uniref:LysM peptidoglycan-binding domain-containing protein n=1 Tax=Xanthomarina gelatinilytica TaxID=1137281 RepID=UPI003AA8E536
MILNRVLNLLFILSLSTSFAQDSLEIKKLNEKLSKAELEEGETYVVDTIIDGKPLYKKQIDAITKISELDSLQDLEIASDFDKKWLEELYNNTLYDTIYQTVSELEYNTIEYPELSTDTLKARLARLNARTPFNVEYNPSLESVIKNFLKNRKSYFERIMGLSAYYFPMFERELDAYNIPLEMKYLAIVESALNPRAKSRVGATGLWQFMYATGKQYGLEVSSYVDERSDPIKSTTTAAVYLSKLYEIFGDWDLALAAYNSGPGNVSKAIRRSGGYENYWNIRHNLPRETAGYVPAFLATMYIFEYAKEHGFVSEKPLFYGFETDTIRVKQMITLDQVSEATNISIEELQFLNPSYKLDIIPVIESKNYYLRLPRTSIGTFVTNESTIYAAAKAELEAREKPLPQFFKAESKVTYRVKSGDNLGFIARKYRVRVSDIKRWNGLRSNNIRIGQRLTIYPRNPVASQETSTSKTDNKTTTSGGQKIYTVKSGDSLWSISQKFPGVSVQNIRDWNDISGNNLKPGMKLKVSKG